MNGGGASDNPISDNNVSTTNELSDGYERVSPMMNHHLQRQQQHQVQQLQQQCWDLKEEAEEEVEGVADLPEIFSMPVGVPVGGDDGGHGGMGENPDFRGRFRGRLGAKGIPPSMGQPMMNGEWSELLLWLRNSRGSKIMT